MLEHEASYFTSLKLVVHFAIKKKIFCFASIFPAKGKIIVRMVTSLSKVAPKKELSKVYFSHIVFEITLPFVEVTMFLSCMENLSPFSNDHYIILYSKQKIKYAPL